MTTCGYHFSDGQRCNERIYRVSTDPHDPNGTPSGWRHEQGDESRGMRHWARPEESGPQGLGAQED